MIDAVWLIDGDDSAILNSETGLFATGWKNDLTPGNGTVWARLFTPDIGRDCANFEQWASWIRVACTSLQRGPFSPGRMTDQS